MRYRPGTIPHQEATESGGRSTDSLPAADGATLREVAARLYLSEGTVRNYLSTAMQKLGARTRVEAARLAERKGWL